MIVLCINDNWVGLNNTVVRSDTLLPKKGCYYVVIDNLIVDNREYYGLQEAVPDDWYAADHFVLVDEQDITELTEIVKDEHICV